MTTPTTKSWHITPTAAGFLKSQFLDGNDAAVPPTWATIPDFRHQTSVASINVASYLTGSYDSIQMVVISGVLSGSGWTFAAPTLAYTPPGAALLTVRMVAVFGSQVVNSNIFIIESVAAQTADVSPPLIPTGFVDYLNSINQPVLQWKASADPAPIGNVWSGNKDYGVYRDGLLLTRVNAPTPGLQLALTSDLIGAPAIPGSTAQVGSQITMTGGGIDFFNTADSGRFMDGQVTGDFFATGIVSSLVSSYAFSALILDVRASNTDAASPHVGLAVFPFAQGKGYALNSRATQGATTLQAGATPLVGASSLRIALGRVGNVFTAYTSLDGLAWIQFAQVTIALPTKVFVGLACAALQAGVTASATVDQFGVTQSPDIIYTDTTPGLTGPHSYEITARDVALNESAHSNANTSNVVVSPPTGSLNTNYGWYMSIRHANPGQNNLGVEGPFIDNLQTESAVHGVHVAWHWRDLETAQGVYAVGPGSNFYNFFLRCKAANKPYMVSVYTQIFNQTLAGGGRVAPDYIRNGAYTNGGECDQANAISVRIWDANVMSRLIALWQAIYTALNNEPLFEGIMSGETSTGFDAVHTAGAAGYSSAALLTQLQRLIVAANAARKTANFDISANYLGSDAQMEALIQTIVANKGYGGGPDTWNRTYVQNGTRALQYDEIMKGNAARTNSGGYIGKIGQKNEIQSTEIGGYIATFTPAELYDVAYNINKAHYILVDRQTGTGDGAGTSLQAWSTGFLPFIRNNPLTNLTPPTGYVTGAAAFDFYISPTGSNANPGTLASPWAISALADVTKTQMRGKRIGLLDGTYTLSNLAADPTQGGAAQIMVAHPGLSGAQRTIIQAVNPQMAVITQGVGIFTYPHGESVFNVGGTGNAVDGWYTFKDLNIQHIAAGAFSIFANHTRIEGCNFFDTDFGRIASYPQYSDNHGFILTGGLVDDVFITGCTFEKNVSPDRASGVSNGAHNLSLIGPIFYCTNMVVEYCTFRDANAAVYYKNSMSGLTVRYCYFDQIGYAIVGCGFQGSNVARLTNNIYNNVFRRCAQITEGDQTVANAVGIGGGGQANWPADTNFFNNTVVFVNSWAGAIGLHVFESPIGVGYDYSLNIYNNIYYKVDAGWNAQIYAFVNSSEPAPTAVKSMDYNAYCNSVGKIATDNTVGGAGDYTSLATWRVRLGSPDETHSIAPVDPLFVNLSGTTSVDFKLQVSSPCKTSGLNGLQMGAWGGATPPTKIGST